MALRLILAIQMESSKIWLIWTGLTALLLLLLRLLFRLLFLRELLAEPGSRSSKLNAECVDWCASNPPPPRPGCADDPSPPPPARGMLSGCAPYPSKFVCSVRSVLVFEYVFWWPLPALLRVGDRNVDGECSGADPGVPGDRGPKADFFLARCSSSSTRISGTPKCGTAVIRAVLLSAMWRLNCRE